MSKTNTKKITRYIDGLKKVVVVAVDKAKKNVKKGKKK